MGECAEHRSQLAFPVLQHLFVLYARDHRLRQPSPPAHARPRGRAVVLALGAPGGDRAVGGLVLAVEARSRPLPVRRRGEVHGHLAFLCVPRLGEVVHVVAVGAVVLEAAPAAPRRPEAWTVDGMRVVDVPDVVGALQLLRLSKADPAHGRSHPAL